MNLNNRKSTNKILKRLEELILNSKKSSSEVQNLNLGNKKSWEFLKSIDEKLENLNQNSKRSSLEVWDNWATIIGAGLTTVGIIATIFFGVLTYKLTIKYGESKEEIEKLKQISTGIIMLIPKVLTP